MRVVIAFLLLAGCAHAKPARVKPKPPETPPAPVVEKVSESDLFRYKAAYMTFKSLEAEIVEKYRIRAEAGEVFDPDTAVISRVKPKRGGR